ncbi:MAG: DUF4350 domain-containing protein [Leptolyngbya sp. Prado105]|nr:DUF4350 domain-containing protein [Leptolyngbya sp. Prado105]
MKKLDRRLVFGLIAVVALIALTLFVAPRSNRLTSGSTFNRSPDGYGAWYAYMQRQGKPVQRWRKTVSELERSIAGTGNTMIQIDPTQSRAYAQDDWIQRGNTWIIVGRNLPVTEAGFSTQHQSDQGAVKIETARRLQQAQGTTELLGDQFGSIVWEEEKGKGRVIYVGTPFIAANAYQDEPGNFPFFAQLATRYGQKVWVDEYLHGYRDQSEEAGVRTRNWGDYLMDTPLAVLFLQTIVVMLVLIWAKNRRFGQPQPLETPRTNDSQAYTEALAGVLYKAGRSEFVVDVVGREERLQIQRLLGIGGALLDRDALMSAWIEQTGRSASELEPLFSSQRLSEQDLRKWLTQVREIKQHLPNVTFSKNARRS